MPAAKPATAKSRCPVPPNQPQCHCRSRRGPHQPGDYASYVASARAGPGAPDPEPVHCRSRCRNASAYTSGMPPDPGPGAAEATIPSCLCPTQHQVLLPDPDPPRPPKPAPAPAIPPLPKSVPVPPTLVACPWPSPQCPPQHRRQSGQAVSVAMTVTTDAHHRCPDRPNHVAGGWQVALVRLRYRSLPSPAHHPKAALLAGLVFTATQGAYSKLECESTSTVSVCLGSKLSYVW